jgi:hypothetical protein
MAYPKKVPDVPLVDSARIPPGYFDRFIDKPFDEVIATMANEDKGLIATAIINSIKKTGDASSFKILQNSLERQGFSTDKELPITDERYFEIIKVFAARN